MGMLSADRLASLADKIWALALVFVPRLLTAIVIIAVAIFVAQRAARGLSRLIARTGHVDDTLRFTLAEFVRYSIIVIAMIAALEQIGVRATSLFAALGAAGLAIGLALQGTLSNIAAGLMLLWLRPYRVGDYIEVNNVPGLGGTVRQIGLFTCQLEAFDGLFLLVPNSALWNVPLRNYTRNTSRLVSLTVMLPRQFHVADAKKALLQLAAKDNRIAKTPEPAAFVERITGDGVLINFRFWAIPASIGEVQRNITDAVQQALTPATTDAPPVQVTRVIPPDTDPSRLMDLEAPAPPLD